jgi:hypothetical protein
MVSTAFSRIKSLPEHRPITGRAPLGGTASLRMSLARFAPAAACHACKRIDSSSPMHNNYCALSSPAAWPCTSRHAGVAGVLAREGRRVDDCVACCGAHGAVLLGPLYAHVKGPGVDDAVVLQLHTCSASDASIYAVQKACAAVPWRTFEWYRGSFCSAAEGFGMSAYMLSFLGKVFSLIICAALQGV